MHSPDPSTPSVSEVAADRAPPPGAAVEDSHPCSESAADPASDRAVSAAGTVRSSPLLSSLLAPTQGPRPWGGRSPAALGVPASASPPAPAPGPSPWPGLGTAPASVSPSAAAAVLPPSGDFRRKLGDRGGRGARLMGDRGTRCFRSSADGGGRRRRGGGQSESGARALNPGHRRPLHPPTYRHTCLPTSERNPCQRLTTPTKR